MSIGGLVSGQSAHGFHETVVLLRAAIVRRGLTLTAEIDHAAAAEAQGLVLRPTVVLIFGNPRGGTPLMDLAPTLGIDLPLTLLVWKSAEGMVWIAYNDPRWLAERHQLSDLERPELKAMSIALADIVADAMRPEHSGSSSP
jgi:uncharacterized protein (DUF302 family)